MVVRGVGGAANECGIAFGSAVSVVCHSSCMFPACSCENLQEHAEGAPCDLRILLGLAMEGAGHPSPTKGFYLEG
jgi:hypothetical protein